MPSIELQILAETQKATRSIETFGASATKSVARITSSFSMLKTIAVGAVGYLGIKSVVGFLEDAAKAAMESEVALNQLNSALKISGNYSNETSKSLQAFAEQIQATTIFEDDAVIANMALLESIAGLSEDGLKQATNATLDLSAALSIDLETATRMVAKAAEGNTQAFGRYGIEIRKGTTDAETFANTLDALNSKFGGAAVAQVNTFSGSMTQLKNNFGNVYEEIGSVITQNPMFVGATKSMNSAILEIIDSIKRNKGNIQNVINDLTKITLRMVPLIIKSVGVMIDGLNGVGTIIVYVIDKMILFIETILELTAVKYVVNGLVDTFKQMFMYVTSGVSKLIELMSKIPGASKVLGVFGATTEDVQQLSLDIEYMGKQFEDTFNQDYTGDTRKRLTELRESLELTYVNASDTMLDLTKGVDYLAGVAEKVVDNVTEMSVVQQQVNQDIEDSLTDTANNVEGIWDTIIQNISGAIGEISDYMDKSFDTKDYAKAIESTFSALGQGAKGAREAVAAIGGSLVDVVAPGFGAAAKEAIMFLSQDEATIKAQVRGFVEAMPDIIEAIAKNIPLLVEVLVDTMINEGGAFRIGKALAEAFLGITTAQAIGKKWGIEFDKKLTGSHIAKKWGLEFGDNLTKGKIFDKLGTRFADSLKMSNIAENWGKKFSLINERVFGTMRMPKIEIPEPHWIATLRESFSGFFTNFLVRIPLIATEFVGKVLTSLTAGAGQIGSSIMSGFNAAFTTVSGSLGSSLFQSFFTSFKTLFKWPSITTPSWLSSLKIAVPTWLAKLKMETPGWFKKLKLDTPDWFSSLTIPTPGWLKDFQDAVKSLTDWSMPSVGGGGGGDKKWYELASGGVVPSGYPNDSYPAALTSDELVVPARSTSNLFDLIDRMASGKSLGDKNENSQNINITLKVGEKQLADIILNLNRQGYRLA